MLDIDSILSRCAVESAEHLGRKSLSLFRSYLFGYELCCQSQNAPLPFAPIDWSAFQSWTQQKICMTHEHESRLNAWSCVSPYSYATLIAADDSAALETFIAMRTQAICELEESGIVHPEQDAKIQSNSTFRLATRKTIFHTLSDIQARPKLYFGSDWSLHNLWVYFSGYQWCERDRGIEDSKTQRTLIGFQAWMEHRYPFGQNIPWTRIMNFLLIASRTRALDSFIEHLEMYQHGLPSETADPTIQEMLSNIVRKIDKSRN